MSSLDQHISTWVGTELHTLKPIENHKDDYYSASDFGKGLSRKKAFEINDPTPQCNASRCGPCYVNTKNCYICQLIIDQQGGLAEDLINKKTNKRLYVAQPGGKQCEHVLTASAIAMLLGLMNSRYNSEIDKILQTLKPEIASGFRELKEALVGTKQGPRRTGSKQKKKVNKKGNKKQTRVGSKGSNQVDYTFPVCVYQWAHPACNLIKNEFPYLKIDFKATGPELGSESESIRNIVWTLKQLTEGDRGMAKQWRSHFFNKTAKLDPTEFDIGQRARNVYTKVIQPIRSILESVGKPNLTRYSFISICALKNIVKGQLLKYNKPISWESKLQTLFNYGVTSVRKMQQGGNKKNIRKSPKQNLSNQTIMKKSIDKRSKPHQSKKNFLIKAKSLTNDKSKRNTRRRTVVPKSSTDYENDYGNEYIKYETNYVDLLQVVNNELNIPIDNKDDGLTLLAKVSEIAGFYTNESIYHALQLLCLTQSGYNITDFFNISTKEQIETDEEFNLFCRYIRHNATLETFLKTDSYSSDNLLLLKSINQYLLHVIQTNPFRAKTAGTKKKKQTKKKKHKKK